MRHYWIVSPLSVPAKRPRRGNDPLQLPRNAFYALDRTNFLTPGVFVSGRTRGSITRTRQPRSMQFAVRRSF